MDERDFRPGHFGKKSLLALEKNERIVYTAIILKSTTLTPPKLLFLTTRLRFTMSAGQSLDTAAITTKVVVRPQPNIHVLYSE